MLVIRIAARRAAATWTSLSEARIRRSESGGHVTAATWGGYVNYVIFVSFETRPRATHSAT
jgi:hypothetical protein